MTTDTDFTTSGLIASLPHPYDTYLVGDAGEFRPVNPEMSRFLVTLSKADTFWVQDTRRGVRVLNTGDFFLAVQVMLALNVHHHESPAKTVDAFAHGFAEVLA